MSPKPRRIRVSLTKFRDAKTETFGAYRIWVKVLGANETDGRFVPYMLIAGVFDLRSGDSIGGLIHGNPSQPLTALPVPAVSGSAGLPGKDGVSFWCALVP